MTWTDIRHNECPSAPGERCCEDCVDTFCSACGGALNAVVTFNDADEEGVRPLWVVPR